MEGFIVEKWKDRFGKKVKVGLCFMFKVMYRNKSRKLVICYLSKIVVFNNMRNIKF